MGRRTRQNGPVYSVDAARPKVTKRDYRNNGGGYVPSATGTIGAWAAATAITTPRDIQAVGQTGALGVAAKQFFTYTCGGKISIYGGSFPQTLAVAAKSVNNGARVTSYCIDFMYHGAAFDVKSLNITGYFIRVVVDGTILGAIASDATNQILPITFPDVRTRRIQLVMSGTNFMGLNIGPNDSIWKTQINGPRVIVAGDSYTDGTGATYGSASSWVRSFANTLGLDDVWASGVGGTGYMNPGTNPPTTMKMRDRITDVTDYNPDVVIWAMGHNDATYTLAQTQTEAAACFAAVKAACPNAKQIALSPLWGPGVSTFGSGASLGVMNARDGIKAAAAAAGIPFVDLCEMPLDTTPATATLNSATTAGYATLPLTAAVPVGSTVHVGTYPAGERREVTAVSGPSGGVYTASIKPNMTGAYAAGTVVTEVGQSFFTGPGHVGATTGFGNSDILIGSDGAHPTQAGHDALGIAIASQLGRYVLASA